MREVIISEIVSEKILEVEHYLRFGLNLSKEFAHKRSRLMREFAHKLAMPGDYAICRFEEWALKGYHCVTFDRTWVFAYEVFAEGVLVRDMRHAKSFKG